MARKKKGLCEGQEDENSKGTSEEAKGRGVKIRENQGCRDGKYLVVVALHFFYGLCLAAIE